MAISLGEKLREARESRGITISEVAEQTRISSLYLEGIEADDYRTLPGGIFNKGFVKSYARFVGVDEQEALQDYASLISTQDSTAGDDPKIYKPEVLTDDRNNSSGLLTIIFAVIILGLISWGAYTFANYYGENAVKTAVPTDNSNAANPNSSSNSAEKDSSLPVTSPSEINVELKAVTENTAVTYTLDGENHSRSLAPGTPLLFNVKERLLVSYSKYHSANVTMTVNGKQILLPSEPANPNRQAIDFVVTKENILQILQKGQIVFAENPDANPGANVGDANGNRPTQ